MKSKVLSFVVNSIICITVLITSVVGFYGGNAVTVSTSEEDLYYGVEDGKGVSLMFNVYQNTENVYKILNILKDNSATATFFIGGSWADDNVDCVRKIYASGHEIASHGYFHKDHSRLSYSQNLDEIKPSVKLLNMITGDRVKLFAPPSGSFDKNTISACSSLGLKTIMWTKDTIDWRDDDPSIIYDRATKNLKNGDFILMHPMDATVSALENILTYIRNNEMQTVSVSFNLGG